MKPAQTPTKIEGDLISNICYVQALSSYPKDCVTRLGDGGRVSFPAGLRALTPSAAPRMGLGCRMSRLGLKVYRVFGTAVPTCLDEERFGLPKHYKA